MKAHATLEDSDARLYDPEQFARLLYHQSERVPVSAVLFICGILAGIYPRPDPDLWDFCGNAAMQEACLRKALGG